MISQQRKNKYEFIRSDFRSTLLHFSSLLLDTLPDPLKMWKTVSQLLSHSGHKYKLLSAAESEWRFREEIKSGGGARIWEHSHG